jgi:hypothetical protein
MSDAGGIYIEISDRKKRIRLRRSLFWEMPANSLDPDKNKRLILERVFTRGNIEELSRFYSREEIRETVKQIGYLDQKTLHFISKTYQIKPEDFKCYKKSH